MISEHSRQVAADRRRRWRVAHPEAVREQRGRWGRANPTAISNWARDRRARERSAFVEKVDIRVLFERDQGICQLCKAPVDTTLSALDPRGATVDHRLALARGGKHSYANCQLAHLVCNLRKGAS